MQNLQLLLEFVLAYAHPFCLFVKLEQERMSAQDRLLWMILKMFSFPQQIMKGAYNLFNILQNLHWIVKSVV